MFCIFHKKACNCHSVAIIAFHQPFKTFMPKKFYGGDYP